VVRGKAIVGSCRAGRIERSVRHQGDDAGATDLASSSAAKRSSGVPGGRYARRQRRSSAPARPVANAIVATVIGGDALTPIPRLRLAKLRAHEKREFAVAAPASSGPLSRVSSPSTPGPDRYSQPSAACRA
jgi:hypothetical protein